MCVYYVRQGKLQNFHFNMIAVDSRRIKNADKTRTTVTPSTDLDRWKKTLMKRTCGPKLVQQYYNAVHQTRIR